LQNTKRQLIHLMRIGAANCILIAFGVDTEHSLRVSSRNGAHCITASAAAVRQLSHAAAASVETYCTRRRANSKKSLSSSFAHCRTARWSLECWIQNSHGKWVVTSVISMLNYIHACFTSAAAWAATG